MGEKSRLDFGDSSPENSLMHSDTATRKPDFSGWASKYGLQCTDGRTILPGAFAHQDKVKVPLVWQHGHDDSDNVLGHAIIEHRDEGPYVRGYFNDTERGQNAKKMVEHEDIDSLSIFANKLVEKAKQVSHGVIREVSLVLARANPGALIDNLELQHSDGELVTIEDEAVIYTGEHLNHGDEEVVEHEDDEEQETEDGEEFDAEEVYNDMSDEQKEVLHTMVGAALEASAATDDDTNNEDDGTVAHTDNNGGTRTMKRNVFESTGGAAGTEEETHSLSHDDVKSIVADATRRGSMKEAVEAYALAHGITDIDVLFPEAQVINNTPEWDKRRTEWVSSVLSGTRKTPFSRIKSIVADITVESARALGYVKGTFKKEEFFGLTKRTTTPTTVYKKQKLDRDDIVDITDLDVVSWLKGEMRLMLEEELARAILFGDGRAVDDEDKIKDPAAATDGAGIRSIANEHELYAIPVEIDVDVLLDDPVEANRDPQEVIDTILMAMSGYKGSGSPTLYTTQATLTKLLLAKDSLKRRYYSSKEELATALGVGNIVAVEVLESTDYEDAVNGDLIGVIVNLNDYAVGTDRGGEVSMFDDFDIDYNQYKYLIETRLSGALTKIRSALVLRKPTA